MRSIVWIALLASCTAKVVPDPGSDGALSPRQIFDRDVAPMLDAQCVSCHNASSGLPLTYESITSSVFLNGNYNPQAAHLLTQGVHEGPALDAVDTSIIVEWLDAERAARGL